MKEISPPPVVHNRQLGNEQSPNDLFMGQVDRMVQAGVDLDRESLLQAGKDLIEGHDIKPEFFEDPARSAMFLGVANKFSQIESGDQSEIEHIYDVLTLLAGEDSAFAEVFRDSRTDNEKISEEKHSEIIAKFSNKEVARDLKDRIAKDGLLESTRKKMGITEETERPYEIYVLNITPSSGEPDYNYVRKYGTDDSGEWTEDQDVIDQQDNQSFEEYKKGLIEKSEEFRHLMKLDEVPAAWARGMDGKSAIFIPLPLAERLAYADEPYRPGYWSEYGSAEDVATLRHEYAHTQAKMSAKVSYLGIGIEELKAEHYSGNGLGYNDIKKHFQMLGIVGGYSVKDVFESFGDGNPLNAQNFYQELAKAGGLDLLYDATVSIPHGYCREGRISELQREIVEYSGGQDGIQERAWDRVVAQEGEEVATQRLVEYIDWAKDHMKIMEGFQEEFDGFEFFLNHGGPSFLSRKIEAMYKDKTVA